MNAEALTIMETDDEEEYEEERINKNRPQQSQKQNGKKQNQVFTKDLPSMEDNIVTTIDTIWSIGCTTPQTEITEITVPDTHKNRTISHYAKTHLRYLLILRSL